MRHALAAACFLCLPSIAFADISIARTAYVSGAYEDAARNGEAAASVEGYALAAKALLARRLVSETADVDLSRIMRDAERALELDPNAVDARLSLATAYGIKSRRLSVSEALRKGYGQKGKQLIDEALALDPDNARGLALLGGWHLEVLRRVGPVGASFVGVKLDRGLAAFDRAMALAPDNPAIPLHCAIALLALDADKHGGRAKELLALAASRKPADAFEASATEEARRLGALAATQGSSAAARLVMERPL